MQFVGFARAFGCCSSYSVHECLTGTACATQSLLQEQFVAYNRLMLGVGRGGGGQWGRYKKGELIAGFLFKGRALTPQALEGLIKLP